VGKRNSGTAGKISKRIFDFLASAVGLILLSPLLLVIAIIMKLKMPGPVLFKQQRTGRNGKPFTIFKFRSMTLGHQGSTISVKGEKRITPFGAFLRKYKLDELPELWNVVRGDMSLVGPRPDMPEYLSQLSGEEKLILELRPGITGPASLKYAREEELLAGVADPAKYNDEVIWPDKVRINLDYYYNRSFLGDIQIILRTILPKTGL
jgi:lipopolysaccharide/colanic/teichoic acid biosynthesis glycosyltransferase